MDCTKAWNGDVTTFFDYLQTDGGYTGLDLDGSSNPTPQIAIIAPVTGAVVHLGDAIIGSNSIAFIQTPGKAILLVTITGVDGWWHELRPVSTGPLARRDMGKLAPGM
jgi:hypothetical protein